MIRSAEKWPSENMLRSGTCFSLFQSLAFGSRVRSCKRKDCRPATPGRMESLPKRTLVHTRDISQMVRSLRQRPPPSTAAQWPPVEPLNRRENATPTQSNQWRNRCTISGHSFGKTYRWICFVSKLGRSSVGRPKPKRCTSKDSAPKQSAPNPKEGGSIRSAP